ncbi:MAG: cobalamin B12-binding domain-containing protein, partial [Desulfarculaceae bacterium]
MNVLLIHPSYLKGVIDYYPLGIAYAATIIARCGHNVELMDFNLTPEIDLSEKIQSVEYSLIGVGGFLPQIKSTMQIVDECKSGHPNIPIILGGPLVNGMTSFWFSKTEVDFAISGDSECVLPRLLERIEAKDNN